MLTRHKKVKTAVHGCNSWLLVWTLSCRCPVKLFTQYQPCIIVPQCYFLFLADQIFYRSCVHMQAAFSLAVLCIIMFHSYNHHSSIIILTYLVQEEVLWYPKPFRAELKNPVRIERCLAWRRSPIILGHLQRQSRWHLFLFPYFLLLWKPVQASVRFDH